VSLLGLYSIVTFHQFPPLQTLALEVAQKNITVNAICPGYVLTDLVKNQIKDTARIRGIPESAVISDVLLADQPTKQVRERDGVRQLFTVVPDPVWNAIGLQVITGSLIGNLLQFYSDL